MGMWSRGVPLQSCLATQCRRRVIAHDFSRMMNAVAN